MSERLLNNYYNWGGFNQPARIGYVMKLIRKLRPITEEEWKIWYLENVHDEAYLERLATEMFDTIPKSYNVSVDKCKEYIYDVMFRRTFQGYNKEKLALKVLRSLVSPNIQESPEEWDTLFFIDFFVKGENKRLIGIQLKPETFYQGHYQYIVDIEGKMKAFREKFDALTYVLIYRNDTNNAEIKIINQKVIDEIKSVL